MFAKLKPTGGSPTSHSTVVDLNPIAQYFEVGKLVGSAGPELAWKIYDAVRKSDRKEASIFFFDKRVADKLHKPKRKETIAEILRFSVRQLERHRHPKILALLHGVEESSDTLAFASEPVLGSLANVYEYLEERLPQGFTSKLRDYQLSEFELKYGLLQLTEALMYLHSTARVMHRHMAPQSILINRMGTWKLSGMECLEKCHDTDIMRPISCQPYTSKLPKMGQSDLDFMPPEVQTQSISTPMSDMFSLGLLIVYVFNKGRPLISANLNPSTYLRQLDLLNATLNEMLPNVPTLLHDSVKSLLEIDYKKRLTSQNLLMIKYFNDSSVQALQYLDIIQMKDTMHKASFYYSFKNVLPFIPKKMWGQHVLPSMECELQSPEVLAAALQPIIYIINESTNQEFEEFILPFIKNIFQMPKSVQATVTLLENLDIIILKISAHDFKQDLLPMICNAFDSSTPQIQSAAMSALPSVIDHLDGQTVRQVILPRTKQLFDVNADSKIQINILMCIEKVIENLDKTDILDDVLPMLMKARITDASVLIIVINICKLMMIDVKKYGVTITHIATKLVPALAPALANPTLNVDEFDDLMDLMKQMLAHVGKNQRIRLINDKAEPVDISQELFKMQQSAQTQSSNFTPRPPTLRLESRRTSISMDDVVRRISLTSAASSPDSNLLRVQAHLPGRRHSDNTIQPPRILIAPSSPTTSFSMSRGPTVANLTSRRHSSINMQDTAKVLKDFQKDTAKLTNNITNNLNKTASNITNNLGIESFLSSRSSGRRYSAVPNFDTRHFSSSKKSHDSGNFLSTLGTGVQQLFGK